MINPGSDNVLNGIAIIGTSCRFPGAKNIEEFWQNLWNGRESISFFKREELDLDALESPSVTSFREAASRSNDPNYVRARGVLDNVEFFDASFFGMHPREAEVTDPQHRVFIECVWESLENAGYDPDGYEGLIGVYGGMSNNTYLSTNLWSHRELIDTVGPTNVMMGNEKDYLTTRVSYKLNLKGPSVNVYTACSTSLVAVCEACQHLLSYQCDIAVAGGVSISFPQKRGYLYRSGGLRSPDGHCRAFDAKSAGTVFSDGVGIVVLKRLSDAIEDRDNILAVIKGYGLNNDGSTKVSFTAPSVDGQAEAIAMAMALAGFEAESISYVEAHGTGTELGDPIEVAALTQAFRATTNSKTFCGIGSVKTNIGHLDAAAGVAGLIKTVLALKHKKIPPNLHFERPNPKIDFADSPFYVVDKLIDWKAGTTPRRAGVSSFGVGGTNAHVVLEEAPPLEPPGHSRQWQLVLLSAKTNTALETAATNLGKHFNKNSDLNLPDAAFTLQVGRRAFPYRRCLVARDLAEVSRILHSRDPKRVFSGKTQEHPPPVIFMFPGQGAQRINMGLELYQNESIFKEQIDICSELLRPHLGMDVRKILYPAAGEEEAATQQLLQTRLTQPALFAVEYALAQLWMKWGIHPAGMIGHSVGEYVAACLAGVFSLEEALALVAARGQLMQEMAAGSMMAVRMSEMELRPLLREGLSLAAVNSPSLCVVSGQNSEIKAFESVLSAKGGMGRILHTSHAFHSDMMDPILPAFTERMGKSNLKAPQIPFLSNLSGKWITESEATAPHYWAMHLRHTVRFSEGVQELLKEPSYALLEVGPGQTLSTLVRQHPGASRQPLIVSSLPSEQIHESETASMLEALGRLWLVGVSVDWKGFYAHEKRHRIPLPTYPFERKRYWIEPAKEASLPSQTTLESAPFQVELPATTQQRTHPEEVIRMEPIVPGPSEELTAQGSRAERIMVTLKGILQEVSGLDIADIGDSVTFLEMGFDSLFLTQASQVFESKLGVRVTFRQLLDDLCTLRELAAYLDQRLPAGPLPGEPLPLSSTDYPMSTVQNVGPSLTSDLDQLAVAGPGSEIQSAGAADALDRVIKQQLQVIQQLQMLQKSQLTPQAKSTATGGSLGSELPGDKRELSTSPGSPSTTLRGEHIEPRAFGPYRPIEKGAGAGLTEQQQKYLADFIERYTRRTKESKRLTQLYRARLADPRSVSGFRSQWKEMVYPIVSARSAGSRIWDVDGNEYIDLVMGFGVNLFGHLPPFVKRAIEEQLNLGIEIGPQSRLAGQVAALFCEFTGMERATFSNTGSEAVTAALRVARTVTGRHKVVMFAGSYHGVFDEVVIRPLNLKGHLKSGPAAPGLTPNMYENMTVLDYGTPESIEIIKALAKDLAAVLVEPVQSRHPELQPKEFLQELRSITERAGIPLIFDEMVTGFRIHPGGVQALYGIQADIATYGKVIAGGLPVGVLAGKKTYMDALDGGMWQYGDDSAPEVGMTYFAGTFIRHPLTIATVWAVLNHLKSAGPELQTQLNLKADYLVESMNAQLKQFNVRLQIPHFGSIITLNFGQEPRFAGLLSFYMRSKGVNISEGRQCFLSTAHTDEDIEFIIRTFRESLQDLRQGGFLPEDRSPRTASPSAAPPTEKDSERKASSDEMKVKTTAEETPTAMNSEDSLRRMPPTEAQRDIWLATQLGEDASSAFIESLTLHLRGVLRRDALERTVQQLFDRHEALRITFSPNGEEILIAAAEAAELPLVDLTDLDKKKRDERIHEILDEETRKPFDLVRGPLVRFQLIRVEEQYHLLVLTVHHIVCDGASVGVLLSDLSAFYLSACQNSKASLPPPMQLSEYVQWEASQRDSAENKMSEAYWLKQFADSVPVLDLPTDRPRPIARTFQCKRQTLVLRDPLLRELRQWGAQNRSTLFVTLLAGYGALLERLTQREDVVVGMFTAGQSLIGRKDLVGHFVNMLPLRLRAGLDLSCADYLKAVKGQVLDAQDHNRISFARLVQKLNLPRDPSRLPLVSVTFNIDRAGRLDFEGLNVEADGNAKHFSNFDLLFNGVEGRDQVRFDLTYNNDLFDDSTIARWLGHYQTLLEGIVADPGRRLSELPLLSEAEREQILVEWNRTEAVFPRALTVPQLFEAQVERTPDAVAVVCEQHSLTYRELNARANQLAHYLRKQGVQRDTLVGLCVERSLEMVVTLLGILKAGGAYVPLDPTFPKERLAYMLDDSGAKVLLIQSTLSETLALDSSVEMCLDTEWKKVSQESSKNPSAVSRPEDLAYVIYTSGSTGKPKGVQIEHRSVVNFLESMRREPGISESDVLLAVTTLSFDIAGLELYLPLISGARLILATADKATDGTELAKLMVSSGATVMQATPATWRLLLDSGWTGRSNLKILCGGEALPLALAQQLLPKCTALWNLYGPTETTIWSTLCQVKPEDSVIFIGRPIANTQIYILDEQKQPVPIGVTGKLYIGGDGLARGYLNRPELTAEKFIPNPFSKDPKARLYDTGDLARYRVDGRLECLGRVDQQVKLRGFRIELGEIEAVLRRLEGVAEAVVVAREDSPGDQRLVAYLVAAAQQEPSFSQLRQALRAQLPDYMIPAAFVRLDLLPLTPNGKVDRKALPKPEGSRPDLEKSFQAPRTPVEQVISDIWTQVIGLERVGVEDNFFDLGGHSLLATRVISRLRETFDVELPLRLFFESPTVDGLAETILKDSGQRSKVEKRAEVILRLSQLSDDQVRAMLDKRGAVEGSSKVQ